MKHETSALLPFIKKLNSEYWLPAIQREFVWKEAQICKLFDSLMRNYPIGSFLIWETNNGIRKRRFCDVWSKDIESRDLFLPVDSNPKKLILDGQQRLQGMLIGCLGSFAKKRLYFNIISGAPITGAGEIKESLFEFSFKSEAKQKEWHWFKLQSILDLNMTASKATNWLQKEINCDGFRANRELIADNIGQIVKVFKQDQNCAYQLLGSTESGDSYADNDVVEIFVRANSGGTKLGKSELLFALLASQWDEASENLDDLESALGVLGFEFTRDYFLKACLIILGKKAQYDVKKFRNEETLEQLKDQWDEISSAITDVIDFLPRNTPIADSKALPSRNALLPVIVYRFRHKAGWKSEPTRAAVVEYLVQTGIAGTFNGAKDDLIDELSKEFARDIIINIERVYATIVDKNRSLKISKEKLFSIQYQNEKVLLVMKLIVPEMMFVAANVNNLPQVDHLFSKKVLKKLGFKKSQWDQLANLAPLSAQENQSKSGKSLAVWLEAMRPADRDVLCRRLLIPLNSTLWSEDRFEDFVEARKGLFLQHPAIKKIIGEEDNEDGEES